MRSKLFLVFLVGLLLGGGASAFAQAKKKPAPSNCSGEWTGVITYTRTQTQTDNKTTDLVSGRGKETRHWEMRYNYKGTAAIHEGKGGGIAVKGTVSHSMTSTENAVTVERNSCDGGKTWKDMSGTFMSETHTSGQGSVEPNVNIGVNSDGTYSISVGLPEIDGTVGGSQTATYSGQCTPKKGKNTTMPDTPTKIQGHSLTSDGSHKVDPYEPDRLAGSYSLPLPGGVVESISWNLQRCAAPLRVIDIKFEHMKFPKWEDWQEIVEQNGTVDGNWVKIKATVFNASGATKSGELRFQETYKGDKWDGAKPDAPLKDTSFSVTLEGGEEREVEMIWNTTGYAWYDDGRPRLVQRIKAELWDGAKKVDELTRNVKILPRPLILVAGIWTDPNRFDIYQNILTTSHSYGWKSHPLLNSSTGGPIVIEGTSSGTSSESPTSPQDTNSNSNSNSSSGSVYAKAEELDAYIKTTRTELNAWHVDILGHGTGGLQARLWVHKHMEPVPDGMPVARHLLVLGTPNGGLPCADSLAFKLLFKDHPEMVKQVTMEEMALFNKYVTERKGTKFSALAGNSLPVVCNGYAWGDGYVPVESATAVIEDHLVIGESHNDLLGTKAFSDFVKPHIATGPKGTYPLMKK